MTTMLRGYAPRYIGLAADPKPILENNSTHYLAPGAEFYELDTYTTYIFDGAGTWYLGTMLVSTS